MGNDGVQAGHAPARGMVTVDLHVRIMPAAGKRELRAALEELATSRAEWLVNPQLLDLKRRQEVYPVSQVHVRFETPHRPWQGAADRLSELMCLGLAPRGDRPARPHPYRAQAERLGGEDLYVMITETERRMQVHWRQVFQQSQPAPGAEEEPRRPLLADAWEQHVISPDGVHAGRWEQARQSGRALVSRAGLASLGGRPWKAHPARPELDTHFTWLEYPGRNGSSRDAVSVWRVDLADPDERAWAAGRCGQAWPQTRTLLVLTFFRAWPPEQQAEYGFSCFPLGEVCLGFDAAGGFVDQEFRGGPHPIIDLDDALIHGLAPGDTVRRELPEDAERVLAALQRLASGELRPQPDAELTQLCRVPTGRL